MTISDVLVIFATITGPILAVQAQKWVERYKETRNRKLNVFSTLMTTRATKLAVDRVRALNTIDLVFIKNKSVIDKWREYQDALSPTNPTTEEKFIDLLFEMSRTLGFNFDRVMLRRGIYIPQAHVDAELQQQDIQKNLQAMLVGQQEIQRGFVEYISGKKPLRVKIDKENTDS